MEVLVMSLLYLASAFIGASLGFKQLNQQDVAEHMCITAAVIIFGVILIKVYS